MKFTQTLWNETATIYKRIINHPFNVELANGSLDKNKFKYYVQQDSLYLQDYARALAIVAAKAPNAERINDFLIFAKDGIWVEQQLHQFFYKKFDIPPCSLKEPGCFGYANFLLSTTSLQPYEVGVSALLPCFWIYREVGVDIVNKSAAGNPYQPWIDTYSGEEFKIAVEKAIEITGEAAQKASEHTLQQMKDVFILSTKLEWKFWDAAYNLDRW
ncbi:MAG: thiaminase II [Ignavibacteria bacterium]|jgi:thiaminase/transcriptional activator TenA